MAKDNGAADIGLVMTERKEKETRMATATVKRHKSAYRDNVAV
jgi:hypothetical protein